MHDNISREPSPQPTLVVATFFGHFNCTVNDRAVPWLRRMDRRIFRYLLLKADGAATRDEIRSIFWPEMDPAASNLSLRTACSNIRKAIGTLAGPNQAENYFCVANDRLSVNLERMNVDVRRYIAHIRAANFAYAADEWQTAYMHYQRAAAMYVGHLGWGDEPEAWLEPLAAECAALQRTALERVVEISHDGMLARDSVRPGAQGIA